jgi:protein-tyrosine-phosphatase
MPRLIFLLLLSWAAAGFADEARRTVIFVCEKGSVKSVLAAAQFNRLAQEKGLPFTAVPRGTRSGEVVPDQLVGNMKADGLEPGLRTSRQLAAAEAREAAIVVSMCDLPAELSGGARVEAWSDIPPVTVDYAKARDALAAHVARLAAALPAKP